MHDVIPTLGRSDRLALSVSLASFAVAGVANTSVEPTGRGLLAVALAVAGVYALARCARGVDRRTLATLSLGLWLAFLAVAAVHAVGLGAAAAAVPAPTAAAVLALHGATWATLLGAAVSSSFLAFREYGARSGVDDPEDRILEGGFDL
nr:hypothetical protein [Salinilacihabitans rarus]